MLFKDLKDLDNARAEHLMDSLEPRSASFPVPVSISLYCMPEGRVTSSPGCSYCLSFSLDPWTSSSSPCTSPPGEDYHWHLPSLALIENSQKSNVR